MLAERTNGAFAISLAPRSHAARLPGAAEPTPLSAPTSLFDFLVLPGPAARGQVTGPGVLGASAGIQTTFSLTVQDQFGNVRDDRELVNILFADENDVNITWEREQMV